MCVDGEAMLIISEYKTFVAGRMLYIYCVILSKYSVLGTCVE